MMFNWLYVLRRSPRALRCAMFVVRQQCGTEMANQLRTLGTKVMAETGCETRQRL